jgi:hypothetical protein
MTDNDLEYLATMTVADFKRFKKALAILTRANITRITAISILVDAHRNTNRWRQQDIARRA